MIEVLHGHLLCQIGEHHNAIISALLSRSIAEWRHTVGKIIEFVHPFHTLPCSCHGRRLRDGVDTDMVFATVDVTKAARNALQEGLCVSHVVITVERALCRNIAKGHNRPVLADGIKLLCTLNHLVERYRRHVERRVEHLVVKVVVSAMLTNVGRHTDGMQHEINLPAQYFH